MIILFSSIRSRRQSWRVTRGSRTRQCGIAWSNRTVWSLPWRRCAFQVFYPSNMVSRLRLYI